MPRSAGCTQMRRTRARSAALRRATVAVALGVVTAACSVNEPRHGFTAVGAGGGRSTGSGVESEGDARAEGTDGEAGIDAAGDGGSSARGGGAAAGSPSSGTNDSGSSGGGRSGGGRSGSGSGSRDERTGSAVGVTADAVTISYASVFSGPTGQLGNLAANGFNTWVADVNSRGGIHGRRVVVKRVDHRGTPEGGIAACKEAESNGSLMVVNVGTAPSLVDCLDATGVPVLSSSVQELKPWRMLHSVFLDSDRGRLLASFVKGALAGTGKKIGVLHTSDPFQTGIANSFVADARKRGLHIVEVVAAQQGQASFTSELLRLRDAGAEIVILVVIAEALGIVRDAKAIRYEPVFTGAVWCIDEFTAASPELFQGIRCLRGYPGAERPEFAEFRRKAQETGNRFDTTTSWSTYSYGLMVGKVLETSGRQLTRETFVAAFDQITGYDNGIAPPLDRWRDRGPVGTYAQWPVVCCNPNNSWKTGGAPKEEF